MIIKYIKKIKYKIIKTELERNFNNLYKILKYKYLFFIYKINKF